LGNFTMNGGNFVPELGKSAADGGKSIPELGNFAVNGGNPCRRGAFAGVCRARSAPYGTRRNSNVNH
jgi:hypothetical protein